METIAVREAVSAAQSYLEQIYPSVNGLLVEEVEMDEEDKFWFITISFPTDVEVATSGLAAILSPKSKRHYKIFKIDAQSGRVISMKIRVLSAV